MLHVKTDKIVARVSFDLKTKLLSGDVRLADNYNRIVGKINNNYDLKVSDKVDPAMKALIKEEYLKVRSQIADYGRMWNERSTREVY